MARRRGARRRRHQSNTPNTANGEQQAPAQSSGKSTAVKPGVGTPSESGSDSHSEVDQPAYDQQDSLTDSILAPSLATVVSSYLIWWFSLLSSIWHRDWEKSDGVDKMVLGFGRLWGEEPKEDEIAVVDRSEGKKVKRRRRKTTPAPDGEYYPGMVNLSGVLCYMNSVLQSLASVTSLVSHLERMTTLAIEADMPTPVTDALSEVLSELNTPHTSQPRALRPHGLITALHPLLQIRRLLATREQQDAHELFVVLAEAISDESLKIAAEVLKIRGLADILSLQAYCQGKGDKIPSTSLSATFDKGEKQKRKRARGLALPWEGLTARRRVCRRCGWHGEVRMDTLGGMELPIPLSGDVTLDACISEYLAPELLSGVTCELCSTRATLDFYQSEVSRLSLPPNQSHLNGHSHKPQTPSGSFSALEDLPSTEASSEISDRRRKKAKEAKKIETRLREMVDSTSLSDFGEGQLSLGPDQSVPIKWHKVNSDSIRQTVVTRPPQSLRLHIARSGISPYGMMVKKSSRVAIPILLDLTRFTARGVWEERSDIRSLIAAGVQPSGPISRVLYRLESAILHYGYTSSSGHFVCIRRKPVKTTNGEYKPERMRKSCPDGCVCEECMYFGQVREEKGKEKVPGQGWLMISDADVEEVGEESILQSGAAAVMLFYERIGEYKGSPVESSQVSTGDSISQMSGYNRQEDQPTQAPLD